MSGDPLAPAVAIVGPTASGKTELAIRLARRHAGEIVNFDSVQVYRHLDIGSAKPTPRERAQVPHHLIDHVEPCAVYSAGDFARDAQEVLFRIRARGRLPVLVGGTGFYLSAVLDGLFEGPARDELLRQRLEESASSRAGGHLWRVLNRLDRKAAKAIHPNDQPKIVRAIEVCLLGKRPMTAQWSQPKRRLEGFRVLRLGLDPPREELYDRINRRARWMFEEGLVDEVRQLLEAGIPRTWRPLKSLGYAQCLRLIENECSLDDAVEATAMQTRRYAKRQMTWFRNRSGNVHWLPAFGDSPEARDSAEAELERWK